MYLLFEKKHQDKLFRSFIIFFGILFLFNLWDVLTIIPSWQIRRAVGFGFESNIPTWFTSGLLLYVSYMAYICSAYDKQGRGYWQIFTALFLFLSCDETGMFHERIGYLLNKYQIVTYVDLKYDFEFYLGPLIILIFLVFLRWHFKKISIQRKALRWILSGFIIYLFGAIVLEATLYFKNPETNNLLWKMENLLEESFEIIGVLCVLRGVSYHIEHLIGSRTVNNE